MPAKADKQLEDAVFFTALHVTDPELRRTFLEQACLGDTALREVIEEMLLAHDDAERLIDQGLGEIALGADDLQQPPDAANDASARSDDEQVGRRIGRYTLLERLGEGGCGAVYLAEQEDPMKRLVALKVIKLGMDTRSVIARFDAERQALAMMDHPNIARVLDAGATETGRPYFVMELVRGTLITSFCDTQRYDLRRRLKLFVQVCKAIQHAHQKGVVHRDIKPSNVLVALHDGEPVPKVIDFGIAKAIDGRLSDDTRITQHEQMLGTPAYMSPEQAEFGGLDVDTRSDVYSLGVLLHELLTGRTPTDTREPTSSGEEMRRRLRQQPSQRPSTVLISLPREPLAAAAMARSLEPSKLVSQVRGDLDWITLKALEIDRTRRYETTNGLAHDVERYLANEAISARPPGRFYQLGKLVRRHAVFFGSGAVAMLLLTAGMGTSIWLYLKSKRAELRQAELREIAEQALRNEASLRRESEAREKLTEAVILVRQGDPEGAAEVLGALSEPPSRPSLDGVTALRSVGEWLAIHGRWREASERFLWLLEIDKLDPWGPVTLDTQACGVVLVENGDPGVFRRFCEEAILTHAASDNGDAVGRVLKTCLLTPPDAGLWQQLQPLGATTEQWFETLQPQDRMGWALIPACLWHYRGGDYDRAIELATPLVELPDTWDALHPTLRAIYAMTAWQRGDEEAALVQLAKARDAVNRHFAEPMTVGDHSRGIWYDWLFARAMVREATLLTSESR